MFSCDDHAYREKKITSNSKNSEIIFSDRLKGEKKQDSKSNFGSTPFNLPTSRRNIMSINTMQTGIIEIDSPGQTVTHTRDTSSFASVTFPTPFPSNSKVMVIPQVQTFRGPDTPGVRITDVTTTGFKIRMNELVVYSHSGGSHALSSDHGHTTEVIGWIALSV